MAPISTPCFVLTTNPLFPAWSSSNMHEDLLDIHQEFLSQFGSTHTPKSTCQPCFFSTSSKPPGKTRSRKRKLTLHKTSQDPTTGLQQGMTDDNLQEPLKSLPTMLNDIVAEAIRKDLARQLRNSDPGALSFEDVAEVFKVRVPSSHAAVM